MIPTRRAILTGTISLLLGCRRRTARHYRPDAHVDPAARIVSLSPITTEILFALGGGDRVVGISNLCDGPPEALRRPRTGTTAAPSYEAIHALHPDAITAVDGPAGAEVLERLQREGASMIAPRIQSLAELREVLPIFASLIDDPSAARRLATSIDAGLARVRRAVEGRVRPRVVVVYNLEPLVLAGRASWANDLLEAAGGENAVRLAGQYPLASLEQVMATVPSVILDLTPAPSSVARAWSEHRSIPAVAAGRVLRLDDRTLRRPGPRVVQAVNALARALHPGVSW
jgi:iron complex transport system substrate-binding protein